MNEAHQDTTRPVDAGRRKRPYEKPCVTFREPLEGVAAVCDPGANGKASPATCLIASS